MAMDLNQLLAEFAIDAPHVEIEDIVLDSRDVGLNSAFIALKGHQMDGRDFIPQAISLGAKVIINHCEKVDFHGQVSMREHSIIVDFFDLPAQLSRLAQCFFCHPAKQMSLVAITGTNGKTSTAQLIAQLGQACGTVSGSIGTLGAGKVDQLIAINNTTPDAILMQRLLASMAGEEVTSVAYEASSHALVQGRITDIETKVAVFTNLSRDHLDYHGSMQKYAEAKLLLRQQPGLEYLVVNQHDRASQQWLKGLGRNITSVQFGFDKPRFEKMKYVVARDVCYASEGTSVVLDTSWGSTIVKTQLMGEFNVLNLLAAVASQLCLGHSLKSITTVANQIKPITGRMELFSRPDSPSLVVDYAHTPDALENALLAARNHTKGKLWVVFGCGGDRDQGKRPLMGEVAEKLADNIVLTNDNVRNEQAASIIEDILTGILNPQQVTVEFDRTEAITQAFEQAQADDLILLAGKGHEQYQIIGDCEHAYDERALAISLVSGACDD